MHGIRLRGHCVGLIVLVRLEWSAVEAAIVLRQMHQYNNAEAALADSGPQTAASILCGPTARRRKMRKRLGAAWGPQRTLRRCAPTLLIQMTEFAASCLLSTLTVPTAITRRVGGNAPFRRRT